MTDTPQPGAVPVADRPHRNRPGFGPADPPGPRRIGGAAMNRVLRSLASTAVSVALLVGVPWLLTITIGNPLHWLPDLYAGDVTNQVVLAALAAVAWLAWAQFAVAFLVELVSAARRTPMPARIPGVFAVQQGLARALINGALLLLPVTVSSLNPAGQALAMTAADPPAQAAVTTTHSTPAASTPAARTAAPAPRVATAAVTVTGDGPRTWWDLASTHLGDGTAWRQLRDLNQGRVQADGTAMTTDRVVLQPGWTVQVPATAATTDAAVTASWGGGQDVGGGDDVTVREGDTLSQIALDHGIGDWQQLWPVNADRPQPGGQLLTDPDHIEPGWSITIPGSVAAADTAGGGADTAADTVVTVAPGDTLSRIAADHGADTGAVFAVNQGVAQPGGGALTDPADIEPGWRLVVPRTADNTPQPADTTGTAGAGGADNAPQAADNPPAAPVAPTADSAAGALPAPVSPPPAPTPTPMAPPITAPGTPAAVEQDAVEQGTVEPGTVERGTVEPGESSRAAFTVFTGAGGVLAAAALAALVRYRRRQFRHRLPGHSIAATPDELVTMERALLTVGGAHAADATWLDQALRGLAQQLAADTDGRLPDVVAVCLTDTGLQLVLDTAARTDPPGAWSGSPDGTRWTLRRTDPTGYDPGQRGYTVAPFPALATVGYGTGGEHWLLDLERIGALTLAGDPDRALALARFLAAELAHNSWSEMLQVTLVGFGQEMADMHPDRLAYAPDAPAALTAAAHQHRSVTTVVAETGVKVLRGRLHDIAGDVWAPHVLLIAPHPDDTDDPNDTADPAAVRDLVAAVTADTDRSTVALVMTTNDDQIPAGRWRIRIDGAGVLSIPALGVELTAQQIPAEQAGQMAQLLAFAAATNPAVATDPEPVVTPGEEGTASPGEAAPAVQAAWARAGSALPLPDQTYLDRAATTAEDLRALAPAVPDQVRATVEAADSGLDADLDDWRDGTTRRPKLALLGPVTLNPGRGNPAPTSSRSTEIVAYLATRPGGVGIERYATDLWPDEPDIIEQTRVKSKVRTSASQVRKLLGVNPRTGTDYLPKNAGALGAEYRLDGDLLIDAELFRRLRVRGLARGPEGIPDLWAALDLVSGAPFSNRRPGGYGWLAGLPLDHEYTAMIVDLAHVVATHHLAAGEPDRAAAAAQTALRAGSSEDFPLLDLVAACQARGQDAQAESWIKQIMANHDAADEEDLPPRTYEILRRRRWLPPAA